ncbi:MAG: T9SS type A sorting domain-containing protein [Saprospiraceae bacterium]
MRKLFMFVFGSIILIMHSSLHSQSYSVSVSNEPFTFLENGIAAVTKEWSDPAFTIPIGFKFHFFDDAVDSLYSLDFFAGTYFTTKSDLGSVNLLLALNADLIDRGYFADTSLSPITYKTEGIPGQRVFTLEFRNAGFTYGETNNDTLIDFINLQLTIHEGSSTIDVHIGPYSVDNVELDFDGFSGPTIGLAEDFDFINDTIHGELILLAGDPLTPEIITENTPSTLEWPIPENTVYTFSHNPTRTKEINSIESNLFYYPNPTSGIVTLSSDVYDKIISPVYVINLLGEIIRKDYTTDRVELENLPAGIYTLSFQTPSNNVLQRILLMR